MADVDTTVVEPTVESNIIAQVESDNEPNREDQAKEVLDALSALDVTTPEQVQNLATASSQAGNLGNMLGQSREEVRRLNEQVQQLQQQSATQRQQQQSQQPDYYGESDITQSAAMTHAQIESAAANAVRTVLQNEFIKPQQEANARYYSDLNTIQSDQDYGMVKETWDKVMASPAVQQRISSGQSNMTNEYNNVVRSFYRNIAKQSRDVIQKYSIASETNPAPHIESSSTNVAPMPTTSEEVQEKIKKLTEPQNWRATDDQLDSLVDMALGDFGKK